MATPNEGKKILVIEDDVFLGDVLIAKLKGEKFNAMLARDGKEGLDMMREQKPDLVLLDIILPTMNGYEILEARSKDPALLKIPVIVISNSGQPVEINRVLSMGVKDYLVKAQFDPSEVLQKVKNELESGVAQNAQGVTLGGRKIMWVEDDKFLSDLISRKLSTQGCILIHAGNGEEALAILEKEKPDLMLLDIMLPGITGFDILQKVKSNPMTKDIPVIMLSNLGQRADIEKSEKLGALKFLIKATVTLDEIVSEIKKGLATKK